MKRLIEALKGLVPKRLTEALKNDRMKRWMKALKSNVDVLFSVIGIILSVIFLLVDDPGFIIFGTWLKGAMVMHGLLLLIIWSRKSKERAQKSAQSSGQESGNENNQESDKGE